MKQVDIHEVKTHLSRLLREVEEGEEIVIRRNGHSVARLVPFGDGTRQLSAWSGRVWVADNVDDPAGASDSASPEHLLAIGRDCAAHMKEPYLSIDHADLLYDERGLPR
jgi:prevent-host-death family protein